MKNLALILILSGLSFLTHAQTIVYLDNTGKKVKTFEECQYYITTVHDSVHFAKVCLRLYSKPKQLMKEQFFSSFIMKKKDGTQREWYVNGKIKEEENYNDGKREGVHQTWFGNGRLHLDENYKNDNLDGNAKEWYPSGLLKKDANYKDGVLIGQLLTYWENGKVKRDDTYKMGELISGQCTDSIGNKVAHFDYIVMPQFPENAVDAYLSKNIRYPVAAQQIGAQGRVIVQFVVNVDGTIIGAHVSQGVNPDLDAEAVRVVSKMPQWIPAKIDGEPIKVQYTLPVNFKLQ
jgi:TonB family protein